MTTKRAKKSAAPALPPVLLFVYGTLRSGRSGGGPGGGSELVEERATIRGLRLGTPHGGWPAAFESHEDPGDQVIGQVWRIAGELLPSLDHYEGVSSGLFRRVEMVTAETATPVQAYLWGQDLDRLPIKLPPGTEWPMTHADFQKNVQPLVNAHFAEQNRLAEEARKQREAEAQKLIDAVTKPLAIKDDRDPAEIEAENAATDA